MIEHGFDLRRSKVFRGQPVASTENRGHVVDFSGAQRLAEGSHRIEVQRLAHTSRLFGTVEYRNLFDGFGQHVDEHTRFKRTIHANFQQSELGLTGIIEEFHGFLGHIGTAAHNHQYGFRFGMTIVFVRTITPTRQFFESFVNFQQMSRNGIVHGIAGFRTLEPDIRFIAVPFRVGRSGLSARERKRASASMSIRARIVS